MDDVIRNMKRLILTLLISVSLIAPVNAKELNEAFKNPQQMRVTCYHGGSGVTASGTKPVAEYTCGARRDLIGCVALVWADDNGAPGEFVGIFEVQDTGSAQRIKDGYSIDVYQECYSDCEDWIRTYGDYMWVQYVRGHG